MIAIGAYVLGHEIRNGGWIALAVVVGAAIAVPAARRVQMTQMPQLVAAFNGVGGGAAALVAIVEFTHSPDAWSSAVIAFTVFIGGVSLTGSFITFGKLQGIITSRAVVFPGLGIASGILTVAAHRHRYRHGGDRDILLAVVLLVLGLESGCCSCSPSAGRRSDRHLAVERVHRPRRCGQGWSCRTSCCSSPAPSSVPAVLS